MRHVICSPQCPSSSTGILAYVATLWQSSQYGCRPEEPAGNSFMVKHSFQFTVTEIWYWWSVPHRTHGTTEYQRSVQLHFCAQSIYTVTWRGIFVSLLIKSSAPANVLELETRRLKANWNINLSPKPADLHLTNSWTKKKKNLYAIRSIVAQVI